MKIVSACLAGVRCAYDGKSRPCSKVIRLVKAGKAIPVCPEQLGGLATPRDPAEQIGTKVVTIKGKDVTANYRRGARQALKIARLVDCREAILKARSPACGSGKVYNGTFSHTLTRGDGVLAELLKKNDVKVVSEEDL